MSRSIFSSRSNRPAKRNWRFYIWLCVTLLFMFIIFIKSNQPYQQQDLRPSLAGWFSLDFLMTVLPKVEFHYDKDLISWQHPYDMLEFFIRKAAHITEYAVLTFLWVRTLSAAAVRRSSTLLLSALISLLYAASDEWHQSFVANRTGHPIDVGMDSVGILLVIGFYMLRSARSKS